MSHRLLGAGLAAVAIGLASPAWAEPTYQLRAVAELGDLPRADLTNLALGWLGLSQTQLMARIPTLELSLSQQFLPALGVTVSGALRQDLEEPLADAASYEAYQARIAWNQKGGVGLNPLYLARLEDALIKLTDPERPGGIFVGQFMIPFGNADYLGSHVPLGLAARETPMTLALSAQAGGVYQGSTGSRWRDIGAMLSAQGGSFPYYLGIFNGSGPNRLDDNGAKDYFGRLDWRTSPTDLIGASVVWGQDQLFPRGFADPGVSVGRRRYGVHWRFAAGSARVLGEWTREITEGLGSPREGWVTQAAQDAAGHRLYLTYAQYFDPTAIPARGYLAREAVVGDFWAFAPGLAWRAETSYRWEFSDPQRVEDFRILTSFEATLGTFAQAQP